MSIKKIIKNKTLIPLFFILVLGMAACGPTAVESDPESETEAAQAPQPIIQADSELLNWLDTENSQNVDSGAGVVAPEVEDQAEDTSPITISEGSDSTDLAGIPIGFTDDGRPYRGDPHAPIVIEEFSDFQCPYCARFASQTLPGLLENQIANGEAVLIYYDFPLYSIHPQAEGAANASRCAAEQSIEAYWAYHDILFERLQEWAVTNPNDAFIRLGQAIGLDNEDFAECVQNGRHINAITEDYNLGISRGVNSTPSFFLNEQPLVGAQPISVFNQAITTLLNGESLASAQPQSQPQEIVIPTPAAIPLEPENVAFAVGDPNAPVQIVEYTDYQCPYCQQYSQQSFPKVLTELIENGRVYYVFKDFPLDQLHPQARAAAKAVRCGGEQEAYLEMHDAVFDSQATWGGQTTELESIFTELAVEMGLDAAGFKSCYQSDEHDQLVEANLQEGQQLGVNGTPSFFFNGYLTSGALPYDSIAQIVGWAENDELTDVIEESYRQAYEQQQQVPPTPSGPVEVPIEGSYAIGDPSAPVTIVEYTDYQCPYCGRHFAQTFPTLKEKYVDTGMVYYVFKDFPLTSIHPQAVAASEAARCAGDQEAYLEMHDMLFANQNEWNGRSDAATIFSAYAADLGLDTTRFDECLSSNQHENAVMADLNEGLGFGVSGTPTFFINGQILVGAQPLNAFDQAILALTNSTSE